MNIGEKLKLLRENNNMTRKEVADRLKNFNIDISWGQPDGFCRGENKMKENEKIEVQVLVHTEDACEKVKELIEELKKANSLADELAEKIKDNLKIDIKI